MLTIEQIKNLTTDELSRMNKSDLVRVARDVGAQAQRRFDRLKKYKDIYASPAFRVVGDNTFKTKLVDFSEMSRNQIYSELLRAKQFIESKTSTVTGAQEFTEKIDVENSEYNEDLKSYSDMSEGDRKLFWQVWGWCLKDDYMNFKTLDTHDRKMIVYDIMYKSDYNSVNAWNLYKSMKRGSYEQEHSDDTADFFNVGNGADTTSF